MFKKITKPLKKISLSVFAVFSTILISLVGFLPTASAAPTGPYLDPANLTVDNGQIVNLTLRVNLPEWSGVNYLLKWDSNFFDYIGNVERKDVDVMNFSKYNTAKPNELQIGIIKSPDEFNRDNNTFKGDDWLTTISLKVKGTSGSSSVTFDGAFKGGVVNTNNSANALIYTGPGTGSTVSIKSAPVNDPGPGEPQPPSDPGSTPQQPSNPQNPTPTTPNGQTPVVSTPTVDEIAPKLVSSSLRGFIGEVLSAKVDTDKPTMVTVFYGPEPNNLPLSTTSGSFSNSQIISLGQGSLAYANVPSLYYKLRFVDQAGNVVESETSQVPTSPIKAIFTIADSSGNIQKNTTIKINGREFTTDENGKVTVENLIAGSASLVIIINGQEQALPDITLVAGVQDQQFEVKGAVVVARPINRIGGLVIPIGLSALLAIVGFVVIRQLQQNRYRQKEIVLHTTNPFGKNVQDYHNSSNSVPPAIIISPAEQSKNPEDDILPKATQNAMQTLNSNSPYSAPSGQVNQANNTTTGVAPKGPIVFDVNDTTKH